jgi:GH24 family phage-related lysozyme (muramidase)
MIQERAHGGPQPAASGAATEHAVAGKHTQVEAVEAAAGGGGAGGVDPEVVRAFLTKHEAVRYEVYLDSKGLRTGGIGHLLEGTSYRVGQHLGREQVARWFHQDLAEAIGGARKVIGAAWDGLAEARKIVVIDMVFNLGIGGFSGFHQTIAAIRRRDYAQAAIQMRSSAWAGQVGARATEDIAIMRRGKLAGTGSDARDGHDELEVVEDEHGVRAEPDDDRADRARRDDGWRPAPKLADVEHGKATLHEGERGGSVRHAQKLLAIDRDGLFGPATRRAVVALQHDHHMKRHDGVIDAHTLDVLTRHPVDAVQGESKDGAAQRSKLLGIARAGSQGRRPDGRCYYHVCMFLVACGHYGKITNPYKQFTDAQRAEAHDFADLMSAGVERWGLERVAIRNPYDAPSGSIVVVAAGSPGTHHPTAGDIAVADGHGQFYNGGMMGYGGRAGWDAARGAKVLGCYIPR